MNEVNVKMEPKEKWFSVLIETVRGEKLIYNRKHPQFTNKIEKRKCWDRIAAQVGKTRQECEKRWRLLRERFGRELRKRESSSGSVADWSADWPYFESMQFLKDVIKNRRIRCIVPSEGNIIFKEESSFILEEDSVTTFSTLNDSQSATSCGNGKSKSDIPYNVHEVKQELTSMKEKYQNDDTDVLFFRSIVSLMKDFDPRQKDEVRSKIFHFVMEERLKRFECERRLEFALKVQQELYLKKLNEIEAKLREEFDRERLEMQELYDTKYGQIVSEIIQNTRKRYEKIIDDLKANCTCGTDTEVIISSASVSTVSSLKCSSGTTPSLESDTKISGGMNFNKGPMVDTAKRIWNDFEYHLRTQINILQSSNICDLVQFICSEKLESQRRVETVQKEACEKIELLKKYLFDLCCKIRNMKCQCPKEEEARQPMCLGLKYCRCEHRKVCVSTNGVEKEQLTCSCCGKQVDNRTCGGKNPTEGKGTCGCPVQSLDRKDSVQETLDCKLSCFCGKEEEVEEEHMKEKQLCCVCRAKQICTIVGNMKWPQPPRPPCICPDRKFDPSIPCQCQWGNDENFAKSKDKDLAAAAVVFPEYIGEQIYCDCHSSSSEEECPCLDRQELLDKNFNLVNVCWKKVENNEFVRLKENTKDEVFTETSSEVISKLEEEKKSISASESSLSTQSELPAEELKKKIRQNLDTAQLVDCIFELSTAENLQNPEYLKARLADEMKNRIEKIFARDEPKEETPESYSQGSTSSTSISQLRFVDDVLKVKRKLETRDTCKKKMPLKKPKPIRTECKLEETTRDILKNYIPLPKYMVPIASLFEGGWCYSRTTDKDWKIITELIKENCTQECESEKCFAKKKY